MPDTDPLEEMKEACSTTLGKTVRATTFEDMQRWAAAWEKERADNAYFVRSKTEVIVEQRGESDALRAEVLKVAEEMGDDATHDFTSYERSTVLEWAARLRKACE